MTTEQLEALVYRESLRQAAIARAARERGGVYDRILGKWIDWSEDGPVEAPRHEALARTA